MELRPRHSRGWSTAALLVAAGFVAAPSQAAERFGLFVGTNRGADSESTLRWAEADAARVRELFVALGGVADERAQLVTGAEARDVEVALQELARRLRAAKLGTTRVEAILYFSGHGDADSLHLGRSRLGLADLAATVAQLPADVVVVVVDACRAAAAQVGRQKGARLGPEFDIRVRREAGPSGRVLISSAGPDEVAQESDALGSSLFTHHLASALTGAADDDGDGQVSLAEAYRYAYHATLTGTHLRAAAVQHPEMAVTLGGEGELVLTRLTRAVATLLLPAELEGSVLVVDDEHGRVLAEVEKTKGVARRLALPSGRVRVQVRRGDRVLATEVSLAWGGEKVVAASALTEQALVTVAGKGAALDPEPWSLSAALVSGPATVLSGTASLGAGVGVERRLANRPWFGRLSLDLTEASADNEALHLRHLQTRVQASVGYGLHLGPWRLEAGVAVGALVVAEGRARRHAARLQRSGLGDGTTDSWTVGPFVGAELGLTVALSDTWGLVVAVAPAMTVLRVDANLAGLSGGHGRVGVVTHF